MAVGQIATIDYFQVFAAHTSVSGTNTTENSPVFINKQWKGVMLMINRTADTGTCTLDLQIQYQNPLTLTWTNLQSAKNVSYADGTTGERYVIVYPGLTGSDADASIAINTSFVHVGAYLPRTWRVQTTNGGTTVTNTYSCVAYYLP